MFGAFCFGAVVGWFLYFTNRYRKEVAFSDVALLVAAVAGGAITSLYGKDPTLFASYGVGLATGFFGYFAVLIFLLSRSQNTFSWCYLIDGRRKDPGQGEGYGTGSGPIRQFNLSPQSVAFNKGLTHTVPPGALRSLGTRVVEQADAQDHADLDQQFDQMIQQIDRCYTLVIGAFNNAEPGPSRVALASKAQMLTEQRSRLIAMSIRVQLSKPEFQRAIDGLNSVSANLNSEAENLRQTAAALASAAKIVSYVSEAIGIIAMVAA